jgi:hypothetical protein
MISYDVYYHTQIASNMDPLPTSGNPMILLLLTILRVILTVMLVMSLCRPFVSMRLKGVAKLGTQELMTGGNPPSLLMVCETHPIEIFGAEPQISGVRREPPMGKIYPLDAGCPSLSEGPDEFPSCHAEAAAFAPHGLLLSYH